MCDLQPCSALQLTASSSAQHSTCNSINISSITGPRE